MTATNTWTTAENEEGRFQVYDSDLGQRDWHAAMEACAALTDDGGGWRLTTIMELKRLYGLNEKCRKEQGFGFSDDWYWAENQADLNQIDDGAGALFVAPYERDNLPGYYRNFENSKVCLVRPVRGMPA